MLESVVAQIAPKLNISRKHSVLLRLFPHARRALLIDKLLKWFNIISLYWRSGGQPRQQSSESIASRGCIWVRAQAELSLWKKMCTAPMSDSAFELKGLLLECRAHDFQLAGILEHPHSIYVNARHKDVALSTNREINRHARSRARCLIMALARRCMPTSSPLPLANFCCVTGTGRARWDRRTVCHQPADSSARTTRGCSAVGAFSCARPEYSRASTTMFPTWR
jgi:hypothetical protein